ncbi:hypothetical protein [Clostridium saccharobutylicum]|uniref:Uncharacterized protein n=1 Tax=Clostridium saccharobutylicum TaxID=169679 RepID=A0A1S8NAI9_CLOSA|nr:hypothetical protein [Clostridium saccharobutylicum]OOM13506.1 hypothetical protein CLOSAC_15920 [Clostridium saccharobutylicum]
MNNTMKSMEVNNELNYYYNLIRDKWWDSSSYLKLNKKKINYSEKKVRETRFDNLIDKLINQICKFDINEDTKICNKQLNQIINKFTENSYIFDIDFENILRKNFFEITKTFIEKAKNFDEDIDMNDIGQAMRNVWIINIIQAIKEEKIELSNAVFSYSMLYPYTDNYLDNTDVGINDKIEFNSRLYRRLQGYNICFNNECEQKVYKLIEDIEEVFSREKYPKVYNSLMQIQNGQVLSLNQQDEITIPYERDILGISIKKGGASVLVDGYLVNGELSSEEIKFCVGYGVLLQIADDLQDVREDLSNEHVTIMSQLAGNYKLDCIVNKLINFTIKVVDDFVMQRENQKLKNLIKDNCIMLILFSTVLSKEFFSKEYIKEKEEYLPFTIKYIENLKMNLKKKFKKINNMKNKEEKMKQMFKAIVILE